MTEDLELLAKELGLESLEKEVELKEEKPKGEKPKGEKPKKKAKEKKPNGEKKEKVKKLGKNEKAGEIEGIPVNVLARPIDYVNGEARELKVAWNREDAENYRGNGRILLRITLDPKGRRGGDILEVIAERKEDTLHIVTTNNHSRGLKRAKTWATLLKLAFDPDKDVERVKAG